MKRVGFIINSRLPEIGAVYRRGMLPHYLLTGWDDIGSPMSLMRFHWIAQEVNKHAGLRYELYKPWQRYDAIFLVKSMAHDCIAFAKKAKKEGKRIFFDANVDYYTPPSGVEVPSDILPSEIQRAQAHEITALADGVIASSRHLANICSDFAASEAKWIPDNVNFDLISSCKEGHRSVNKPLFVWWSGMPQKLFEFLAIENTLRNFAQHIHLHFVTNDTVAIKMWPQDIQDRFASLLHAVPHTIHRFESIEKLLQLYASHGGVVVSPRFLDSPYNLGHSEWKITLAMACGLPAICSPVPSYEDVAARAETCAMRICRDEEDWNAAFSTALDGSWNIAKSGVAAADVVKKHYSTEVVAKQHLGFVKKMFT